MKERLKELMKTCDALLNMSPTVEDCTEAENAMYMAMSALRDAIYDVLFDSISERKKFLLIEVTNHTISEPYIFYSREKAYAEMLHRYKELKDDKSYGNITQDNACVRKDCTDVDWLIAEI